MPFRTVNSRSFPFEWDFERTALEVFQLASVLMTQWTSFWKEVSVFSLMLLVETPQQMAYRTDFSISLMMHPRSNIFANVISNDALRFFNEVSHSNIIPNGLANTRFWKWVYPHHSKRSKQSQQKWRPNYTTQTYKFNIF
jgi:hypothetical protein